MERYSLVQEHHKQCVDEFFSIANQTVNIPKVPIVLKGVATPEDALMAYDYGCAGIVLSNHGGRQLDTARSGIENLIEVVKALKTRGPWPNPRFEVFVDGGVRRASDVLKAIALGAKAVGVGRAFMYSFCAYGEAGVEKAIQIFGVCTSSDTRHRILTTYHFRTSFKWECGYLALGPSTN